MVMTNGRHRELMPDRGVGAVAEPGNEQNLEQFTMSTTIRLALCGMTFLCQSALSAQSPTPAELDEQRIGEFAENNYGEFVKDFVAVFVAHDACHFDFVDETLFNSLADDSLKRFTKQTGELLNSSTEPALKEASPALRRYIESLLALSMIDLQARVHTAQFKLQYGELSENACAKLSANIREQYEALLGAPLAGHTARGSDVPVEPFAAAIREAESNRREMHVPAGHSDF
jgi:hypothetical protein